MTLHSENTSLTGARTFALSQSEVLRNGVPVVLTTSVHRNKTQPQKQSNKENIPPQVCCYKSTMQDNTAHINSGCLATTPVYYGHLQVVVHIESNHKA